MYIELALVGDVDSLTETGLQYLEDQMPGWISRPGNPETVLIEGAGQIAGEVIEQAQIVPPESLVYIGTSIYNIPMLTGTPSRAAADIVFAADTPATMVPAGSEVAVQHPSGTSYIFLTDRDAVAALGGNTVSVIVIALDVGYDQNGSFGEAQLVDIIEGVQSITLTQTSFGGTNPEEPAEYLDRLTSYLTLPRRPVLPEDHVTLAQQVPGVGRASAYNLYYPGTTARDAGQAIGDFDKWTPPPAPAGAQTNVPRCTSVAITAEDGSAPDPDLMNEVYEVLNANREVNFLNFVLKPSYTAIDVQAQVKPYTGVSQADAEAAAEDMVRLWLDPQTFNANPGSVASWEADNKVRVNEAIDFLNRASGVWYVENVKIKKSTDGSWSTTDITLPGVAPMPSAGTIDIGPVA